MTLHSFSFLFYNLQYYILHRLQRLEEEFYTVINVHELATSLEIDQGIIDLIFVYWKLKRKVGLILISCKFCFFIFKVKICNIDVGSIK